MSAKAMLAGDFATLPDLIRAHAAERGGAVALWCDDHPLDYATLDARADGVAAAIQRAGIAPGRAIAFLGENGPGYIIAFVGALRAGCVPAPLATSLTDAQVAAMLGDCDAALLFADADQATRTLAGGVPVAPLDADGLGCWVGDAAAPAPAPRGPDDAFNIIYSSGTTGTPKGIVQSHAMRWVHIAHAPPGFDTAVTMVATPLYSNTTWISVLPTLGWGGTVVLMRRFDARGYVTLAERHRGTHTMLVPVQYQRIMALDDFDRFDLSSFRLKTCTSAPFAAALKADILARWPGMLVEYYGISEGGGTTMLVCNAHPDKLGSVGRPLDGHEIRLVDADGREVPAGAVGEVVSRARAIMSGYHGREDATAAATWVAPDGTRYLRHGDLGRLDADGFLTLVGRTRDMIVSGGFNIYPVDIEAVLLDHPGVDECAVFGVPSERWGETPVACFVGTADPAALRDWCNARVARVQRLAAVHRVDALPRNALGKVLKRVLEQEYAAHVPDRAGAALGEEQH